MSIRETIDLLNQAKLNAKNKATGDSFYRTGFVKVTHNDRVVEVGYKRINSKRASVRFSFSHGFRKFKTQHDAASYLAGDVA